MRISIIISVYNCLSLTRRCLETLEQTIPPGMDYEIVLVDDGSTDGSRSFLTDYARNNPRCNVLLNERNLGYAISNNRGAELANGDSFLLLNNDTELLPGWIEPMVEGILSCQSAGIIGNVQRRVHDDQIDHAGVFINAEGKPDHFQGDPARLYPTMPYRSFFAATGACLLIKASLFRSLKGFDTIFHNGGEDMDLNFRVRQSGHQIYIANQSVIRHHVSASPGRNNHHERNTCILFGRWRNLLLEQGARQWTQDYLEAHRDTPGKWKQKTYRQGKFFNWGWRKRPPDLALQSVDERMRGQESVWERMFPDGVS